MNRASAVNLIHGGINMDRQQAWDLVCEYTASDSLRKHMLAVEAAMRAYARDSAKTKNAWGIVGLLHDFDYERWPDPPDHPLQGSAILAERGYPAARDLRHQIARRLLARLSARLAARQDPVRLRRAGRLHHRRGQGAARGDSRA